MLKWTVEFEVDESWIADGFNITDQSACEMLWNALKYALGKEINAKVIKSPDLKVIQKLQGT